MLKVKMRIYWERHWKKGEAENSNSLIFVSFSDGILSSCENLSSTLLKVNLIGIGMT